MRSQESINKKIESGADQGAAATSSYDGDKRKDTWKSSRHANKSFCLRIKPVFLTAKKMYCFYKNTEGFHSIPTTRWGLD